jgi:hypothetical protein
VGSEPAIVTSPGVGEPRQPPVLARGAVRGPQGLLALQRTAGNRAVSQLISRHGARGVQRSFIDERLAELAKGGIVDERTRAAVKSAPNPAAAARLEQARLEREERELAEAFRGSVFYYGTTERRGILWTFLEQLVSRKTSGKSRLDYYWPGERIKAFLRAGGRDAPQAQFMDFYYGQAGTDLQEMRNPVIGKYIHEKMRYLGPYDQHRSGRDTYMERWSTGADAGREGWEFKKTPEGKIDESRVLFRHPVTKEALSGTMEISRLIRNGVFRWGGTIVFEGKYVFNSGNFIPGEYQGDTNKEAVALYPFLARYPGRSRVPFGKGELVFHWGGKETVPTQWLFRQNWSPFGSLSYAEAKNHPDPKKRIPENSIFWKFPDGTPTPAQRWQMAAGAVVPTKLAEGRKKTLQSDMAHFAQSRWNPAADVNPKTPPSQRIRDAAKRAGRP